MKNLSVIVSGVDDCKRFLDKLSTEAGEELAFTKDSNSITFLCDNNTDKISEYLAKTIISEYERKILVRAVNNICDNFSKRDKIEIWKTSMHQLLDDEYFKNEDYISRFGIIKRNLLDCFNTTDTISLEGFINFRLNEYIRELEDVVSMSVSEYMVELEYREFVNMLKYFVSVQTSKYFVVDVFYGENVQIYADGKDITDYCTNEFHSEADYDDENKEDYILNSLITISPKRIHFHIGSDILQKDFTDTLNNVFESKISYCTGCEKCNEIFGIH